MFTHLVRKGLASTCATLAIVASAEAASISTQLNYSAQNVGLGGGSSFGFDKGTRPDIGIAVLDFGARASSGDVDAEAQIGFTTSFGDVVNLSDAANFVVDVALDGLSFAYDTFLGAEAYAGVNFDSFLGINLPRISVVDEGYSLTTEDSRSGFGSTGTNRDTETLAGVGPNASLGLAVKAEVTLDASQTSSFEVSDFLGTVVAEHESGETRTAGFSLLGGGLADLDLSLAGIWSLTLDALELDNMFDTALGLSAGYEVGVAVEAPLFAGSCGNFASDNDNDFGCGGDVGKSGKTSQLTLSDPRAFQIDWGKKTALLGTVEVTGPINAVPLPAGVPLLLTGLAGLAWLRRRRG